MGDDSAEGVSDQMAPVDTGVVEDSDEIVGELLETIGRLAALRPAAPAEIWAQRPTRRGKTGKQLRPTFGRAPETMEQDDRRAAFALLERMEDAVFGCYQHGVSRRKRSHGLSQPLRVVMVLTAGAIGGSLEVVGGKRSSSVPTEDFVTRVSGLIRTSYPRMAALAVGLVDRIPAAVWAAWIVAVVAGTAIFAVKVHPIS